MLVADRPRRRAQCLDMGLPGAPRCPGEGAGGEPCRMSFEAKMRFDVSRLALLQVVFRD